MRINLSSNSRIFRRASALVVSVPKSGRTWLRVLVHHYLSSLNQVPFILDGQELQALAMPNLILTHDLWEHRTARSLSDRLSGKYLVSSRLSRRKPIILLARDPRDVIVSMYFQLTKRTFKYRGSLPGMIRDKRFGIDMVVSVMNDWLQTWRNRSNLKLVRYEDCRSRPHEVFGDLIDFLGFAVDQDLLLRSIEFASFDNMKRMEREGKFESGILQPGDPRDAESFKVRRGVIGGYRDYMGEIEIQYVERALETLDRRFGYCLD